MLLPVTLPTVQYRRELADTCEKFATLMMFLIRDQLVLEANIPCMGEQKMTEPFQVKVSKDQSFVTK